MRGPIGKLGAYGLCPVCKNPDVKWDAKTDISSCSCGWSNYREAAENRKKMERNGELRWEVGAL